MIFSDTVIASDFRCQLLLRSYYYIIADAAPCLPLYGEKVSAAAASPPYATLIHAMLMLLSMLLMP